MNRGKAIVVGLLTLWPLPAVILLPCVITSILPTTDDSVAPAAVVVISVLTCLTALDLIVLQAIYLVHAATSDRVAHNHRALWVVLLFFVHLIAAPVFWYLYMWRQPERRTYQPGAQVLG
jgi:hypothetical protein